MHTENNNILNSVLGALQLSNPSLQTLGGTMYFFDKN